MQVKLAFTSGDDEKSILERNRKIELSFINEIC